MNVNIISDDKSMVVDGEYLKFDFTIDDSIWSINWNGSSGHVEYRDTISNLEITDFSDYQYLVDAFNSETKRIRLDAEKAEIDRVANMTWVENRREEYPNVEDQLDMLYHDQLEGTTAWKDAISKVKTDYPKP